MGDFTAAMNTHHRSQAVCRPRVSTYFNIGKENAYRVVVRMTKDELHEAIGLGQQHQAVHDSSSDDSESADLQLEAGDSGMSDVFGNPSSGDDDGNDFKLFFSFYSCKIHISVCGFFLIPPSENRKRKILNRAYPGTLTGVNDNLTLLITILPRDLALTVISAGANNNLTV